MGVTVRFCAPPKIPKNRMPNDHFSTRWPYCSRPLSVYPSAFVSGIIACLKLGKKLPRLELNSGWGSFFPSFKFAIFDLFIPHLIYDFKPSRSRGVKRSNMASLKLGRKLPHPELNSGWSNLASNSQYLASSHPNFDLV